MFFRSLFYFCCALLLLFLLFRNDWYMLRLSFEISKTHLIASGSCWIARRRRVVVAVRLLIGVRAWRALNLWLFTRRVWLHLPVLLVSFCLLSVRRFLLVAAATTNTAASTETRTTSAFLAALLSCAAAASDTTVLCSIVVGDVVCGRSLTARACCLTRASGVHLVSRSVVLAVVVRSVVGRFGLVR